MTAVCNSVHEDPPSFPIKSRRWSHCGHGVELGLTLQAQENHCTVNLHGNTMSEVSYSLYIYRTGFRDWLSSWLARSLPTQVSALCTEALNGTGHRLLFPAGAVGLLFKCGLWKQLHLMPPSSLFLCEWLLWSSCFKSVSFCHMHALQRSKCCKVKPSLEKPFLSYSWINFQFQTTWFYSCPSNTLIIAFSAFFPFNGEGWDPAHDGIDSLSPFLPEDILRTLVISKQT